MAFNLPKVLKALLFSSSQPLSVKDIQALFARFHDQATLPVVREIEEGGPHSSVAEPTSESGEGSAQDVASGENAPTGETESVVFSKDDTDAELYQDVPSLITGTQIREAMAQVAEEYRAANDIFFVIEGPTGWRLVTHPRFARWIRILRDEPPPVKLTQSALETLAIVAYRQPVTRTEIEAIRGVSAEAGLSKLLERELVYITGRADLPGRPLQYGTTDKFLDFVGVKTLVELPSSDVLSPRQIDDWLKNAIAQKPPSDAEMGLPLEEGEGESPSLEPVSVETEHASTAGASGESLPNLESAPELPVNDSATTETNDTPSTDPKPEAAT